MSEIRWDRLPLARSLPAAHDWLVQTASAGLSPSTIDAYSRAVERYLAHCRARRIDPNAATTRHITAYLDELRTAGLRRATLHQRVTAIRLFYAFAAERGVRVDNPAAGLRDASTQAALAARPVADRAVPWIPGEDEWLHVLTTARAERLRTRVMLALAYDAALRREELCGLRVSDLDTVRQTIQTTASGQQLRTVPISRPIAEALVAHLRERGRRVAGHEALFLSESPRNRGEPITVWTWSKVVLLIARRAGVDSFTTHTLRHLRLTDLAAIGWSAGDISRFAGHRTASLARQYRQLAAQRPGLDGSSLADVRASQLTALVSTRLSA